jgi:hypothetical protein
LSFCPWAATPAFKSASDWFVAASTCDRSCSTAAKPEAEPEELLDAGDVEAVGFDAAGDPDVFAVDDGTAVVGNDGVDWVTRPFMEQDATRSATPRRKRTFLMT